MLITLLTDLGYKDYYTAIVKGKLCSDFPNIPVVDISHEVKTYNVEEAAFIMMSSYKHFPEGTIHLVNVESMFNRSKNILFGKHKGQIFIGPDNGVFPLGLGEELDEVFYFPKTVNDTFPLVGDYFNILKRIIDKEPFEYIGKKAYDYKVLKFEKALISEKYIRGTVKYVDHYGNLHTNIHRNDVQQHQKEREIYISFRRKDDGQINGISNNFNAVPQGDCVATYNYEGFLQVSINGGNAKKLLGLKVTDKIQIDFQ